MNARLGVSENARVDANRADLTTSRKGPGGVTCLATQAEEFAHSAEINQLVVAFGSGMALHMPKLRNPSRAFHIE